MPLKQKKIYISTALPYVNSVPHIGFALEIIQADVVARYHRFLGEEVFFLTGTDENSLKNVQAAQEQGISVKKFVDKNAKKFYALKKILNLSFDDFIKTSEERHIKGAKKFWLACKKYIYKKSYKGLYCVGCEAFYKESELINGLCPEHSTKPELIEEENYFFALSKYQKQLKKIIQEDRVEIIPKTRKNEVLSFINSGLEDFCISRDIKRSKGWGVPVPGDLTQIQWTWFDALSNYINAPGYEDNNRKFQKWWQKNENKLHIIGKGVLRFHAVYWLSMLISANLSLPKRIFAHGYLTVNNEKMSKSLGNVVSPFDLVEKYGTDPVRYFLLREIPPTKDGDFTYEKFENRYNSDLASGLGNLVARVIKMAIGLNSKFQIQTKHLNPEIRDRVDKTYKNCEKGLEEFRFNDSLKSIWDLIGLCDRYIEKEKPWQKDEKQNNAINNLLYLLFSIAKVLQPFLPETSEKIFKQLGIKPEKITGKTNKILNFKIREEKSLFPKL